MPSYEATVKFKILAVNNEDEALLAARRAAGYLPFDVQLIDTRAAIFVDSHPEVSIISNQ
jgi:hypothetical protein